MGSYFLDVQRRIVEEIEAEQELIKANKKLIEIYERKIQAKLAEIWGEENNNHEPEKNNKKCHAELDSVSNKTRNLWTMKQVQGDKTITRPYNETNDV